MRTARARSDQLTRLRKTDEWRTSPLTRSAGFASTLEFRAKSQPPTVQAPLYSRSEGCGAGRSQDFQAKAFPCERAVRCMVQPVNFDQRRASAALHLNRVLVLKILVRSQPESRVHNLTQHRRSEAVHQAEHAFCARHLRTDRPECVCSCSRCCGAS